MAPLQFSSGSSDSNRPYCEGFTKQTTRVLVCNTSSTVRTAQERVVRTVLFYTPIFHSVFWADELGPLTNRHTTLICYEIHVQLQLWPLSLPNWSTPVSKFRLDIDYDYAFILTGISCHEKPYRLCWAVNRALGLDMQLTAPLAIALKKGEPESLFLLYMHENTDNDTACFLVANRGDRGLLVPEQHQADYFFVAKGPFSETDEAAMLQGIRSVPFVLLAFPLVPETLRSRQNLLF
jgi:hypothetical protein